MRTGKPAAAKSSSSMWRKLKEHKLITLKINYRLHEAIILYSAVPLPVHCSSLSTKKLIRCILERQCITNEVWST